MDLVQSDKPEFESKGNVEKSITHVYEFRST